jgi:t-SNARE complex subunit (syntaxin)
MVEQAREAETRMLEISSLSHSFATKVDEQESEVETLFQHAEQTSENLVRGNAYLDSAAKHSRDFRLLVLSILLLSSFGLLFLDWYYE